MKVGTAAKGGNEGQLGKVRGLGEQLGEGLEEKLRG